MTEKVSICSTLFSVHDLIKHIKIQVILWTGNQYMMDAIRPSNVLSVTQNVNQCHGHLSLADFMVCVRVNRFYIRGWTLPTVKSMHT